MTTDLVCFDDITLMADETTNPLEQLEQDIYHVVIENRGENLDDPNGGFGLDQQLSAGMTKDQIVALQRKLQAQITRDQRIAACTVTVTDTSAHGNSPATFLIQIEADTDAGHLSSSFTTTLGATSGGS